MVKATKAFLGPDDMGDCWLVDRVTLHQLAAAGGRIEQDF